MSRLSPLSLPLSRIAVLSCLVFFTNLEATTSTQCPYPSSLWCSNQAISRACKVEEQCLQWGHEVSDPRPVGLGLYYESLCPGCREFIKDQLYPTWKKLGNDVINVTLVPYGNAKEQFEDNKWVFTCQHGVNECIGNVLETCILNISKDFTDAFETIFCMESSTGDPYTLAQKCCSQFNVDYSTVSSCANSSLGNQLEHQMAVRTESLDPPHQYTPWITLNGMHTDAIQSRAQRDLLSLICDTYQGQPPPACKTLFKTCPRV